MAIVTSTEKDEKGIKLYIRPIENFSATALTLKKSILFNEVSSLRALLLSWV